MFLSNKNLKKIIFPTQIGAKEVFPIIEGGKGVGVTNGVTAGHFARAGAVGTFSGVNADVINDNGEYEPIRYQGKTRIDRHNELLEYSVRGAVSQAKRAFDLAGNMGRIHMNILWEMGGAKHVLVNTLERAKGLIHGVTCGAGMPYQLAEIAARYKVYYYPIVSSMRAFRALWKRSYSKFSEWLGAVVYECPWRAGGHNGLSNAEDPTRPADTYPRIAEIRKFMDEVGLQHVPIIVAGGVWHIKDYEHYLDNPEIGKIAFQFGTRPIYTKEYPVSDEWKRKLFDLQEGDVYLNKFSPTGFYSSAVNNTFIKGLRGISERQVSISSEKNDVHDTSFLFGPRAREIFIPHDKKESVDKWMSEGFTDQIKTPDDTIVFVTPENKRQIVQDQQDCMGCLSMCAFSSWATDEHVHDGSNSTGKLPDPRSFCIQKTLQDAIHTQEIENNLMFCGSQGFMFKKDEWYQNGAFMPTISELVERIQYGY